MGVADSNCPLTYQVTFIVLLLKSILRSPVELFCKNLLLQVVDVHGSSVLIHVPTTWGDFILALLSIFILSLSSHNSKLEILVDTLILVLQYLVLMRVASFCLEWFDSSHVFLGEVMLESFDRILIQVMLHILYWKFVIAEVWMKARSFAKVCCALGSNEHCASSVAVLHRRDVIHIILTGRSIAKNLGAVEVFGRRIVLSLKIWLLRVKLFSVGFHF